MKTQNAHTRTAKFIGASVLVGSLFAALTGCASGEPTPNATVDNGTAAATPSASAAPESMRGKLVSVIDGDTVELSPIDESAKATGEPNVKVRILGINAPALDACGGPEAVAELKRIIDAEGNFRVKYDLKSARADSAGNVQGYLYSADGTGSPANVGTAMVQNGFAAAWYDSSDIEPKSYAVDSGAAKIAKDQKKGVWATCDTIGS